MELQEIRSGLDVIDRQIAELFEKRMELCAQAAQVKAGAGKSVYDGDREKETLEAVSSMAAATAGIMALLVLAVLLLNNGLFDRALSQGNGLTAEEKQNENPQAIRETINKARYRALFVFFTVLLPPGVEEYRNDYSFSHGRRALLKIVVLARKIISQQKKR